MKRINSLRFRILASFTIVGFVLSLVFGWMAVGILHTVEDSLSENRLTLESQSFLAAFSENTDAPPPRTKLMNGYVGRSELPEIFRNQAEMTEPGIHEYWDKYQVLVAPLPGDDQFFYLIQDNREVEPLDQSLLITGTLLGALFVTLLSAWLGDMLGSRMMAPLSGLAAEVRALQPNRLPHDLKGNYYNDEVGEVARGLGRTLGTIRELVERERHFTRDASHELRTPVTVIKGAAELIQRLAEKGKPITSPLRRVHRAVKDMENIIETFLYLGREGHQIRSDESFDLALLVTDLIEQNRYLLEEKQVEVRLRAEEKIMLAAPVQVTSIAVGNLIRNAFQYTDQGQVVVDVSKASVTVTDTGRGMDEATSNRVRQRDMRVGPGQGFGLGLSIVNDFCKSFGWQLTLDSHEGKGTTVRLDFQNQRIEIA